MPSSSARSNGERNFERRNYGQSVLSDLLSLASSIAGSGKHMGAQKVFAVAEATRVFGEDLNELPHLKAYAEAAADGLDDFGEYVENTEIADILDDAADFAKRQPAITAAFALAAGILATQVVRNWRSIRSAANPKPRTRSREERSSNARRIH
jgi:hypothetical protein